MGEPEPGRREVLALAALAAASGRGCLPGSRMGAGLPVYTWGQLDELYPPADWTYEPTRRGELPDLVGGGGWQRVGYLRGSGRRVVLWVRRR